MNEHTQTREFNQDELELDLDIGHKVTKLAEKAGASSSEVFIVKETETGFSIDKDTVNFASTSTEFGMGIRVIKDKRLGFGYCTNLAQAENAVKNALKASTLSKQLDFEFSTNRNYQQLPSIFDKSILELTIEDGLRFSNQLISSCKDVDGRIIVAGGGVGYGGGVLGIVTSAGVELKYSGTAINSGVSTIIKDRTISTGFEYEHSRRNDIDHIKVARTAAELARNGQNPTSVDPGKYTVIFSPHALCELLEFTVIPALYGEPAIKGETVYSNRLGDSVANPELSFIDDGRLANGINTAPFDDEGTPSQRTKLIEHGVLKNYLFDRLSAFEFNKTSTGNAIRSEGFSGGKSYRAIPKTKAQNFTVEGRTKPFDTLISEQENALIIHELLGAHTANSASGDFSVNAPSLFKVAKGEITGAGKQVMVVGNLPELMKKITALGDDFKHVAGGLTPVASWIPSIVIDDLKII